MSVNLRFSYKICKNNISLKTNILTIRFFQVYNLEVSQFSYKK